MANTGKRFTRKELLDDLVRLENELGRVGIKEIRAHGISTPQTYRNRFGSVNAAKVEAGLTISGKGRPTAKPAEQSKCVADAAERVLKLAGTAMTATQIAKQLESRPLVEINAKDPYKTVWRALKHSERFVPTDDGAYALRP